MKNIDKLNLKTVAVLTAVSIGTATLASEEVSADEVSPKAFQVGVKSQDGKVLALTQLKENKVLQLPSIFIRIKDKEEVKKDDLKSLPLDTLKQKYEEVKAEKEDKEKILKETETKLVQTTMKQTVSENELKINEVEHDKSKSELKELKEVVETETVKTATSEATVVGDILFTSNSNPLINPTGTKVEQVNPEEEIKEKEVKEIETKVNELEKETISIKNEKETLKVKTEEVKVELEEVALIEKEVSLAIQEKEEEIRIAEEKARKARELEEKRIARMNMNFNANALAVAPDWSSEWVSNTQRVKDSDYDMPSIQATQTGYPGNAYALGNCTWYVYNRMAQIGKHIHPYLGNGGDWNDSAYSVGYTVTNTPVAGSAVVFEPTWDNGYGHVAFVEHVYEDGSFLISEMNVGGTYVMAWRVLTPGPGLSFVIPN